MRKICWNMIALIVLILLSQAASAALDGRVAKVVGNLAYRSVPQLDDPESDARLMPGILRDFSAAVNDRGAELDLGKASVDRVAQAGVPAAPAATVPQDSNGPKDQSSPPIASPPNPVSTNEVARPAPTVPGCALRYLAAELAEDLKGRKWKEFRQEECGASTTLAVFPSTIAPKYSGEKPDKARMLTCADQFAANKPTNGNGGLKWIEKSGGYYSECVVRLKG